MSQMTLGEMLDKLDTFETDSPIRILSTQDMLAQIKGLKLTPMFFDGRFGSYRGDYSEMHLGFSHSDYAFNTVHNLNVILNLALAQGMMSGYKGGEFEINRYTPVWLATDSGDYSCLFVSDIQVIEDTVTVIVGESK